jgi:hypothetical protein
MQCSGIRQQGTLSAPVRWREFEAQREAAKTIVIYGRRSLSEYNDYRLTLRDTHTVDA